MPLAPSVAIALLRRARSLERVVDHEQAGEEDEELPVDQAQHLARVHLAAAEQDAGAGERDDLARPAGEQEGAEQHAGDDEALGRLPGVPRCGGVVDDRAGRRASAARGIGRDRGARSPARSPPGRAAPARRRRPGSARTRGRAAAPIRMFCGLPISVAAEPTFEAHATPSRKGTGARPRRAHASITSGATARHTTSLVKTADSAPR